MDFAHLILLVLKASIGLTVLSLGMNATWADALSLLRQPSLLFRSIVSMSVIMPLLVAALVAWLELPSAVEVALVALAISPVPPLLPRKELKAGGNASYAVGLLVGIGLAAIVTVPLSVALLAEAFGRSGQIAPGTVARIVASSIIGPLVAGILVRQWLPALAKRAAPILGIIGPALLAACAIPLLYSAWPDVRALCGNGAVLAIAAVAAVGLAVGHFMGGPEADNRTILALSTACRHPALALAVAVAVGGETKSEIAAILLYLIVSLLVAMPYVRWRKRTSLAEPRAAAQRGQA